MIAAREGPLGSRAPAIRLRIVAAALACGACVPATAIPTADPTLASLLAEQAAQATLIQAQGTLISYLATRIPPERIVPTGVAIPTPFVTGAVSIEGGRCCIGATAGTTIEVEVDFEATSPLSPVTEMRVRAGARPFDEAEMEEAPWEPYRYKASYSFSVPLNWVGFYVTAQFRDQLHNLSAVVQDDVSVEGMPPMPSPLPAP